MAGQMAKRRFLHAPEFRMQHQAAKAFLAPQKDRVPKIQYPKPKKPA